MELKFDINEDEQKELFIDGMNQVIAEAGKGDSVVCVGVTPGLDSVIGTKTHDMSDEEYKSIVLVGVAKRLGFNLEEK